MLDCLIIGDSIALWTGVQLPECRLHAVEGVPSATVVGYVAAAATLVVSAGSNDPTNPDLGANLWGLRAKASGQVLWILPAHPKAAEVVKSIAHSWGDSVVGFAPGPDHVHPASFDALAGELRQALTHG